jgi:hypothetical protein
MILENNDFKISAKLHFFSHTPNIFHGQFNISYFFNIKLDFLIAF